MSKNTTYIFCVVLLLGIAYAKPAFNDVHKKDVKGKVLDSMKKSLAVPFTVSRCGGGGGAGGGGGGGGEGGSSSCSCGVPNRSSRVVGGQETEVNEYPWQAGLVNAGQTRTWCGGVLINNLYVLTAAHCTQGKSASSIQVLLGDHRISVSDGESRHSIASITNHPSYTYVTSGNDFSLLRLSAPVVFDTRRRPACMPQANNDYAGATAIATGFGRVGATSPQATELQEVEVPVWSQQQCSSKWSIVPTILCAGGYPQGGRSVCMGDSGGPLVTLENNKYSVIGVVSYGRPCAVANTPDVYARVSAVLPWITANTQGATWCT